MRGIVFIEVDVNTEAAVEVAGLDEDVAQSTAGAPAASPGFT
jgi:hypothetical protein